LFLLAGALVALAMPLGLASNAADLEPWERLAGVAVGVGAGAGALWWLERSPWTHVQLDPTRRRLRLVRYALSGRRARWLSFDELESVEVEHGTDSDGGTVWRPAVRLRSGQLVLLSELWSHDQAAVRAGLSVVAEACRIPWTHERGQLTVK
jgi:hypothetical protein